MSITVLRSSLKYFALFVVLSLTLLLSWLRWDSGRPRDNWFSERHGQIETIAAEASVTRYGQLSETVRLISDSSLQVSFRVIRDAKSATTLPVLLILSGHRTGSNAVELFGDVGNRAIVGMDYPYAGPDKVRGVTSIARTIPLARRAVLDTVPAVSLLLDWLVEQDWVDKKRIIIIGASLGTPFAAAAAARDERITGLMLVHGAADNRLWLEAQVARQIDARLLHYPLASILYWLAYGPVFDTDKQIATISPRPVVIVGARDDERTPAGQAELLFDAAGDPKRLRWTEGQHIQPDRKDIVAALLRIADEEILFLTQ